MNLPLVIVWLGISAVFAATHLFAVEASLYWYYSWFDSVMHFWGGLLLGTGIHIFASFRLWRHRPRLFELVVAIGVVVVSWEVFEYYAGLYDPETHVLDTAKDIALGYSGGLLAHFILWSRYNRTT